MDIINRNFFRLLRSGALNEYETLEPMSAFKWKRLAQIARAQNVVSIAYKGLKNHQYDEEINIPKYIAEEMQQEEYADKPESMNTQLSNFLLNKRLKKIRKEEPHQMDASMATVDVLNLIINNVGHMLNSGISLRSIIDLGIYLRTKGDKVDFVKLEGWLQQLHMQNIAQLQGSILMSVFNFEQEEIPFVHQFVSAAYKLAMRSVKHTAIDTSKEWHFRQSRTGFVKNNSTVLRRNLRRSIRYISYAPIETSSNFISNFTRSLSEIEE